MKTTILQIESFSSLSTDYGIQGLVILALGGICYVLLRRFFKDADTLKEENKVLRDNIKQDLERIKERLIK